MAAIEEGEARGTRPVAGGRAGEERGAELEIEDAPTGGLHLSVTTRGRGRGARHWRACWAGSGELGRAANGPEKKWAGGGKKRGRRGGPRGWGGRMFCLFVFFSKPFQIFFKPFFKSNLFTKFSNFFTNIFKTFSQLF
jgi:hypothetical protein